MGTRYSHVLSDRDRRDIQGLVLFDATCPLLRYHFFQVHEATAGRRFVYTLLEHGATIQVNTAGSSDPEAGSEPLVYVGVTWRGLEALAVSRVSLDSLPVEFREGPARRAADLGDVGDNAPAEWLFDPDAAHIAVLVYARQRQTLEAVSRELIERADTHACSLLRSLDGEAPEDTVHPSAQRLTRAVPPAKFILGHPVEPSNRDSVAPAHLPMPIPATFAYNGTFGAFRMLEQDKRGTLDLFFCVSLKDQFEGGVRQGATAGATTDLRSRLPKTRAAAYLLFPSITGLRFMSHLSEDPQTDRENESVDEAIEVVVQSMLRAIGIGPTRDAHPKHHGLVKATVDIATDIPEALRHGLFEKALRYDAYIRFSNGRPSPTPLPDAAPDVRGMALKLFGVAGAKESADEKYTHDFLLASHPVFFIPDVFAYVDFLQLPTLAEKMRLFPELGKSFRSFENPLTIKVLQPDSVRPRTAHRQIRCATARPDRTGADRSHAGRRRGPRPRLSARRHGGASGAASGQARLVRAAASGSRGRTRRRCHATVGYDAGEGCHDHDPAAGLPQPCTGPAGREHLVQPVALPAESIALSVR